MKVLLADPDRKLTHEIREQWDIRDAPLITVNSSEELMSAARSEDFQVVFLCAAFLTVEQLDLISYLKEHAPGVEIIVLCDGKSVQAAENALAKGASSYLMKPLTCEVLQNATRKAATRNQNLKSYRLMEDHVLEDLLGNTPAMHKILKTLYKVAPTSSTILITGETGTGKEFVANIIHRLSTRTDSPFMAVNCGAIPENIIESELFGAKKGAFTGAFANKKGLFEEADTGTLFLDEVGELSLSAQVKLLRFLQEKEIRRVGDTENRKIDTRIIAATNRDLLTAVGDGSVREDLYYRLNVFQLHLPPLRERKETIPNLIRFFALKYNQEMDKEIFKIDPAAQMALSSYDYPGNIRELENIIEHAIVLAEDDTIRLSDLPERLHKTPNYKSLPNASVEGEATSPDDLLSLAEMERAHIMRTLEVMGNNQTEAAKKLGISRSTLWRKVQDHKIQI